jgi:hypothetical protein
VDPILIIFIVLTLLILEEGELYRYRYTYEEAGHDPLPRDYCHVTVSRGRMYLSIKLKLIPY